MRKKNSIYSNILSLLIAQIKHLRLIQKTVQKEYKHAPPNQQEKINKSDKVITDELGISDRVDTLFV